MSFRSSEVLNLDKSYMFSCSRNAQVTFEEEPHLKMFSFNNYKLLSNLYRIHCHLMDRRSLEMTVPFKFFTDTGRVGNILEFTYIYVTDLVFS